jgi:hypothetical protein
MDEYAKLVSGYRDFVNKHKLFRKAAYPTVAYSGEDANPRVTKFGGKYPVLPGESVPKCTVCNHQLMFIVQLYGPALPPTIQGILPQTHRDRLIVLGVCPECLGSSGYDIHVYGPADLDKLAYHDDIGEDWSRPELLYRRRFPRIPNSPPVYDEVDRKRQYMQLTNVTSWTEVDMAPFSSIPAVKQKLEDDHVPANQRLFIAAHDLNMKNGLAATVYGGGWPHFCGGDQTPGDEFGLLLSLCESEAATLEWGEAGTAQIWAGNGAHAGEFVFTCSSH